MPLLVALLLGVVQGVFMFVPVSSTSHLVLTQSLLIERGIEIPPPDSAEMVLFDLVVHVGTLVSIVVVMRAWLGEWWTGLRREWRGRRPRLRDPSNEWTRLVVMGLLAVAVTGVLGLLFRGAFDEVFGSPRLVAWALVVTGFLLWWTDSMTSQRPVGPLRFDWRTPAEVTAWVAVLVGVAQAVSLAPGVSRSGATIFMALLLGLRRELAARFSFAIAIPTILAATGVQALEVVADARVDAIGWGAYAVGFTVAAVVGTVSLRAVLRLLEAARFRVFSVYVWVLAAAVLFTGLGSRLG